MRPKAGVSGQSQYADDAAFGAEAAPDFRSVSGESESGSPDVSGTVPRRAALALSGVTSEGGVFWRSSGRCGKGGTVGIYSGPR